MNGKLLHLAAAFLAAAWLAPRGAAADILPPVGAEPILDEPVVSTAPARAPEPSEFVKRAAEMIPWPLELLQKAENAGFGRTEMITFVSIARKSPKSWEDLMKERNKGRRLRDMSRDAGLDYRAVFKQSLALHQKIDADLAKSTSAATAPAVPPSEPIRTSPY